MVSKLILEYIVPLLLDKQLSIKEDDFVYFISYHWENQHFGPYLIEIQVVNNSGYSRAFNFCNGSPIYWFNLRTKRCFESYTVARVIKAYTDANK